MLMGHCVLTLAFCTVSRDADSSSTSILRFCFSFSILILTRCRASHCSLSSVTVSLCRFLKDAARASDWTEDSSRSRFRRCSSVSRFLFSSICQSDTLLKLTAVRGGCHLIHNSSSVKMLPMAMFMLLVKMEKIKDSLKIR